MFLKFKLKRIIKSFLLQAGMNTTKTDYILSQLVDDYAKSIQTLEKSSHYGSTPQQTMLETMLVQTAEKYMDYFLSLTSPTITNREDDAKLHFCAAVMVVIVTDNWAPMCNKILRLDEWYKFWGELNKVGEFIVKQPLETAPFVHVLYNLIINNSDAGSLRLEPKFPLAEISELINSEYLKA